MLRHRHVQASPPASAPTGQAAAVSAYIDPPLFQRETIAVAWAPPLQVGYGWVKPYCEHRDSVVIFIGGHWAAPGVEFVAPPVTLNIAVFNAAPGLMSGLRPIGPAGVFVPAPPGSRPGIMVPAPVGTAPAVLMSAPPVANVGMPVHTTVNNPTSKDTRITNVTNIANIANTANISNVNNVGVMAPAEAMISGHAFLAAVPAQAHLAAALPPVLHLAAPAPVPKPSIAAFVPGREPAALPSAQALRNIPGTAAAQSARTQPAAAVAPISMAAKVPERPLEPTPSAAQHPPKPMRPAVHDDAKADQQRTVDAVAVAAALHSLTHSLTAANEVFDDPFGYKAHQPHAQTQEEHEGTETPGLRFTRYLHDDEHHVKHERANTEAQAKLGDLRFAVAEHQGLLSSPVAGSTRSR